ncbi:MAG: hypothetical protein EZS28_006835 [Streblomastix strix]|uniref:Uncharacterized protein n=1 Tax=Streblomastix strix TaxID=222440 RepID=A0A5J4WRU4_9EUKA|nr:MAG: hypothetical protein EZS28_006835 [Streblomastix strix]
MTDPSTVARDLIEILNPGRIRYKSCKTSTLSKYRSLDDENYGKEINYRIQLPDDIHAYNHAPTMLYSRKSINEFKQYVRSSIIQMQERTEMIDTKELMVAIYSMEKVCGRNQPVLIPTSVASITKAKNYIKTISFDQSEQNFVEKWLEELFSEAIQILNDNKYSDEIPQRYEIHVIGFDCLKSATTLIFNSIKSNKYEIIDRPGKRRCPIHIIVKSTENSIHLKFVDAKNYVSADMKFQQVLWFLHEIKIASLIPYINHRMYMPGGVNETESLCLVRASQGWSEKGQKL